MGIILALTLSIAGASCLHSFQGPAAAALKRGAIHGHALQSKSGEPVKKVSCHPPARSRTRHRYLDRRNRRISI